jgi:hypothetical protein
MKLTLRHRLGPGAFLVSVAALFAACSSNGGAPAGSGGSAPVPGDGVFESDNPNGQGAARGVDSDAGVGQGTGGTGSGGTGGTGGGLSNPPNAPGGDGGRAIEEADVIAVEGGKLYALSRYGGLTVVDVSVPDRLEILGDHKIVATPFEMYVRDGLVFALYNGYADYDYDSTTGQWSYFQTSYVVALDATDPAMILELGRFPVGGDISDSRIIGDILYVSAFENGYCWGCDEKPRTNVISLDVSSPADIHKVDELSFEEREDGYSWKRSLMATDQRLYIAGPTWGPREPEGTTIQVVDVSDPNGDMVPGAEVAVAGQIDSRWQMDEMDGVLRVISQPFTWRADVAPSVQTFRIESSSSIVPLASVTMELPRPERLQSVRFDGARAYAITFERTDPLFTLDLADPANPRQVGELVMPGWVYHMEPRGDRVLGLGFDQGNAEGSITVSLFDVSDLASPSMLARVNFGGDWGSLAEDQDRIHKAFNILDEQGLILVPFSGWSDDAGEDECGWGRYLSGVQLVDWADDALVLRGVAPTIGAARRGFLHEDRLLTMSDERVQSFDISDRGAPVKTAETPIARMVNHTAASGDGAVLRVSQNWWTGVAELDVTTVDAVGDPQSLGTLSLPELDSRNSCYSSSWLGDVHSSGTNAYLVYQTYEYDAETGASTQAARVLTADLSDPTTPRLVGNAVLPTDSSYYYYSDYYYYGGYSGFVRSGSNLVTLGSTMVASGRVVEWVQDGYRVASSKLEVADLSNPTSPRVTSVPLPASLGFTGLLTSGSIVATSHSEPSPAGNGRVRFYLDRVDVSDPRAPFALRSVNVPGSLIAYDAESSNAVTSDYRNVEVRATQKVCNEQYGGWFDVGGLVNDYETTLGTCTVVEQTLRLVHVEDDVATVIDSETLGLGEVVGNTALGDDRLFVTVNRPYYYYYYGEGGYGYSSFSERKLAVITLSGLQSGDFASARLELDAGDNWGYVPLVARGTKAVLSTGFRGKLAVITADDPARPALLREAELSGYVQDLDIAGDSAVASLGFDGAQSISLAD